MTDNDRKSPNLIYYDWHWHLIATNMHKHSILNYFWIIFRSFWIIESFRRVDHLLNYKRILVIFDIRHWKLHVQIIVLWWAFTVLQIIIIKMIYYYSIYHLSIILNTFGILPCSIQFEFVLFWYELVQETGPDASADVTIWPGWSVDSCYWVISYDSNR